MQKSFRISLVHRSLLFSSALIVSYMFAWPNSASAQNPPSPAVSPEDLRSPELKTADQNAALEIYRAFYYDPRVVSVFTDVQVTNGVATLSGSVQSAEARRAAEELARRTPGITQVVNWLQVVPLEPSHPDEEIYRSVQQRLHADPQVNLYPIQVAVVAGHVYLAGSVDTIAARAKAGQLAADVPGVTEVVNVLVVPPSKQAEATGFDCYPHTKSPSDGMIKQRIVDQLRSSPSVDARQIKVKVKKRVATLTGTVDSQSEREAAIDKAYAGGAKAVRDELKVRL